MISLPYFFNRQPVWPNSEASVGHICDIKIGGQSLYEAKGPVCRLFNEQIGPAIQQLLNDHKEDLERCESRPQHMAVCIRMLGSDPRQTQPVVIVASLGAKQRKKARKLIQEHRILGNHPGVLLKTLGDLPAIPKSKHQGSMTFQMPVGCERIRITGSPRTACGAGLMIGPSGQATLAGVIKMENKFYGITAAHPNNPIHLVDEDLIDSSGDLEFDDDSDSESDCSNYVRPESMTPTFRGQEFQLVHAMDSATATPGPAPSPSNLADPEIFESNCVQPLNDLDYQLFPIEDTRYQVPNSINLPQTHASGPNPVLYPERVALAPREADIWAVTAATGLVKGFISASVSYIKLAPSSTFQEVWTAHLEREPMQGDCGAWVVEAVTGEIFGHIVAGRPGSQQAYLIPAYQVMTHIAETTGLTPILPCREDYQPGQDMHSQAVTSPSLVHCEEPIIPEQVQHLHDFTKPENKERLAFWSQICKYLRVGFLATLFWTITVLNICYPRMVSRFEVFGGSPSKALRTLATLSGITHMLLSWAISMTLNDLHWIMISRQDGISLLDSGLLNSGIGIEMLLGIIWRKGCVSRYRKAWILCTLLLSVIGPGLSILIMSDVSTVQFFYPITSTPSMIGYGIGTFDPSLVTYMQSIANTIFSIDSIDLFSNPRLFLDTTDVEEREKCERSSMYSNATLCPTEWFMPGEIDTYNLHVGYDRKTLSSTSSKNSVLASNQRAHIFKFDSGKPAVEYSADLDCVTSGIDAGAFHLCLRNEESNEIQAHITVCDINIAWNLNCLNDTSWQSHGGWKTNMVMYSTNATVAYDYTSGGIIWHDISEREQTAVNFSAQDMLHVYRMLLTPADESSGFVSKPLLPLYLSQYLNSLNSVTDRLFDANRLATTTLQSLLVAPIYRVVPKSLRHLPQTIIGEVHDHNKSQLLENPLRARFSAEREADTEFCRALVRYYPVVGRWIFLLYITLSLITILFTCSPILFRLYYSQRQKLQQVRFKGALSLWELLSSCMIVYANGEHATTQDLAHLSEIQGNDKLWEMEKMRVVLISPSSVEGSEFTSSADSESCLHRSHRFIESNLY